MLYGNRRVRDRLAEFAPILLRHAEQLPYADFCECVERFVAGADPDGAHDARDDAIEHRNAHVGDLGGMVDITAQGGDGLTTAELIAIHRRFTEAEYQADVDARTYTIRNDGTIMLPVGVRPPTFPTDDDGDRDDVRYLTELARARAAALACT